MMKGLRRTRTIGILYVLPAAVFVVLFSVIPFIWNTVLSFEKWDGFSTAKFAGIQNFVGVFKSTLLRRALLNSMLYAFASTLGAAVLGLVFATFIFRFGGRAGAAFRLILYSPAMLPMAVVGIMFVFIFNSEMGLLNNFLRALGLDGWTHIWLQEKATAMPCIIFAAIWKCAGAIMMMTFAAMQGVPASLYESARLDGATFGQQMVHITYPLIKPMILLAVINTLGTQFKSYDLIFTMTQGGPADLTATVPIVMKKTAFNFGNFGSAAAMGLVFTVFVALSILLVRALLRGESYEY